MGATTRKPATSSRSKTPERDLLDLVAELDAAHASLRSLQTQVESLHAQATLGTIAGMLAHEFNNVLTPVISYAQMALAHPEDTSLSRKALERSLAACEQVTRISASILQFSKSDVVSASDTTPDVPRGTSVARADVGECVQRAIDCLGRDPRKDGVDLRINVPAGTYALISPDELVHVLLNALLNARSAITRRSRRIEICARHSDAKAAGHGRWLVISIEDSGRGMTPEQLQRLFSDDLRPSLSQPTGDLVNVRSTSPLERSPQSRGLGTRIMRRLVQSAGGSIVATSAIDQGTRLEITLRAMPE